MASYATEALAITNYTDISVTDTIDFDCAEGEWVAFRILGTAGEYRTLYFTCGSNDASETDVDAYLYDAPDTFLVEYWNDNFEVWGESWATILSPGADYHFILIKNFDATTTGNGLTINYINNVFGAQLQEEENADASLDTTFIVAYDPPLPPLYGIDGNTLLMLHMDGDDAGTVFTDSSQYRHTVSVVDATTAQTVPFSGPRFGTACGKFWDPAGYVTIPANVMFNFGTGDFCIDFQFNSFDINEPFRYIFSYNNGPGKIYCTDTGKIHVSDGDTTFSTADGALEVGIWTHIMLSRTDGIIKLFKDGSELISGVSTGSVGSSVDDVVIGGLVSGLQMAKGYIDEFRVSNVGRKATEFIPPTEPYYDAPKYNDYIASLSTVFEAESDSNFISYAGNLSTVFEVTEGGVPTPDTIAGCKLWLCAEELSSTHIDGQAVALWPDRSVDGRDAIQETAGSQPIFKTNILNGWPIVRFDDDDVLNFTLFDTSPAFTYFVVWRQQDRTVNAYVLGADPGYAYIQGAIQRWYVGITDPLVPISSDFVWPDGEFAVRCATADVTQTQRFNNGSMYQSHTGITADSDDYHFSRVGKSTDSIKGDIAEIIVYDSVLSSEDRITVESYLAYMYGLTNDRSSSESHDSALSTSFLVASVGETLPNAESSLSTTFEYFDLSKFLAQSIGRIVKRYFFTLTGAESGLPDVEIPIVSFQARRRGTDAQTYLSVVISGTDDYGDIAARANGQMVIDMDLQVGGVSMHRVEIIRVLMDSIRPYEGGNSQSVVLEGHATAKTITGQHIALSSIQYSSVGTSGQTTIRAAVDMYLRPGDTVTYPGGTLIVDNIAYAVSPDLESMTVVG